MNKNNMMKSETKSIVSNQYLYKKGQTITFLMPNVGKIKGIVQYTEYTAQSGYTVALLVDGYFMCINERFLQRLEKRAS